MGKSNYDFLVVYNTCGIRFNRTSHYIKSIRSILDSKTDFKFRVVMSSCLNSKECRDDIRNALGNEIDIIEIDEPYPVNITYNFSCLEMIRRYGSFKGYLYLDSGVDFIENETTLHEGFLSFLENDYGILSFQVDNDHGFASLEIDFPIQGKDYIIPLGGSVNGHADLFSNDVVEEYGALWPDVFSAFCTESTFSFLAASVGKKWAILRDRILIHSKSVDGASLCVPHVSPVTRTPWNNLLCGRNALDFIQSQEAIEAGLGYEECNNVMMHKKEAYDDQSLPLNPQKLRECIKKYFYLSDEELDYSKIECKVT